MLLHPCYQLDLSRHTLQLEMHQCRCALTSMLMMHFQLWRSACCQFLFILVQHMIPAADTAEDMLITCQCFADLQAIVRALFAVVVNVRR